MQIARLFSCSLAFFAVTLTSAQSLGDQLSSAQSEQQFRQIVKAEAARGNELARQASTRGGDWKQLARDIQRLERIQRGEAAVPGSSEANKGEITAKSLSNPNQSAKKILENPLYRDARPEKIQSNSKESSEPNLWDRIGEWIAEQLSRIFNRRPPAELQGGLPNLVTPLMWVIIGIAIIAFAILVAKFFGLNSGKKAKKKVGGLLDEDEPDRTADEWILQADRLEAEGKFREAVRCLYLACLARLNQSGILQFIRRETNWEHLQRFESRRLDGVDFDLRTATQLFDVVYYGNHSRGQEDVEVMRKHYADLLGELKGMEKSA
ncbi:DUF4129 domain-containing protein [Kamptonema cortianum]|nr:DUF4129 domain-containing protein [Geitlerinema splendidum]MDK3156005.1 DUF4129 domain-containing protein [Kamptonema cortianum]